MRQRTQYGLFVYLVCAGFAAWAGPAQAGETLMEKAAAAPNPPYWLKEGYTGGVFYFRQNHDYYEPMLADIRLPVHTLRYYRAVAVPFTQASKLSLHNFADVTFGETFHLFGRDYAQKAAAGGPTLVQGWAAFLEGSAHMLLDFNAPSRDVINTDYRFGAGLSGRGLPGGFGPPWDRRLSWKLKYFHESTHLGDEYSIAAEKKLLSGDPAFAGFRRINVSYEAAELFLALDDLTPRKDPGLEYKRIYGGYRRLNDPGYATDDPPPLTTRINNNEFQAGGELYVRWTDSVGLNPARKGFFFRPQFFILATDAYKREQYDYRGDLKHPADWSFNTLAGVMYGDPFIGENTLRYFLNYYTGLNPHGQFRNGKIHYVGFNIAFDFK